MIAVVILICSLGASSCDLDTAESRIWIPEHFIICPVLNPQAFAAQSALANGAIREGHVMVAKCIDKSRL